MGRKMSMNLPPTAVLGSIARPKTARIFKISYPFSPNSPREDGGGKTRVVGVLLPRAGGKNAVCKEIHHHFEDCGDCLLQQRGTS